MSSEGSGVSRRAFMTTAVAGVAAAAGAAVGAGAAGAEGAARDGTHLMGGPGAAEKAGETITTRLTINGRAHSLDLDPRTTLLDALREQLRLTGTKKGCDQGQCGACTVLVAGRRVNACLTLAVMHDGEAITTIEGLGTPENLHPVQRAFVERDGFQCGYCTSGQIMSTVGVLDEAARGIPRHVTGDLTAPTVLNGEEIRERMSGNICRCAAYPNIVAAIRDVAGVAS